MIKLGLCALLNWLDCSLIRLLLVSSKLVGLSCYFELFFNTPFYWLPLNLVDCSLDFNSMSCSGADEQHTEMEQNAIGDREDNADVNVRLQSFEINSKYHMGLSLVDMYQHQLLLFLNSHCAFVSVISIAVVFFLGCTHGQCFCSSNRKLMF